MEFVRRHALAWGMLRGAEGSRRDCGRLYVRADFISSFFGFLFGMVEAEGGGRISRKKLRDYRAAKLEKKPVLVALILVSP